MACARMLGLWAIGSWIVYYKCSWEGSFMSARMVHSVYCTSTATVLRNELMGEISFMRIFPHGENQVSQVRL